ncbi:MAG: ankyrin repeat domain-containing protein [Fusobacteria bacterium]|nr:ankyrin repeat domain-containing protein [Fusobacteriota bacterium]
MGLIKKILHRENALSIEEFLKRKHTKKKWSELLLEACCDANKELVKAILTTKEIDANHESGGLTPLIIASQEGYVKMVELLMNYPELDVNFGTNHGGTALIMASMMGNVRVIEILLTHPKIDVNIQTNKGQTALIVASFHGKNEVIELLLNHKKVDILLRNNRGKTALEVAKMNGHTKCVDKINCFMKEHKIEML